MENRGNMALGAIDSIRMIDMTITVAPIRLGSWLGVERGILNRPLRGSNARQRRSLPHTKKTAIESLNKCNHKTGPADQHGLNWNEGLYYMSTWAVTIINHHEMSKIWRYIWSETNLAFGISISNKRIVLLTSIWNGRMAFVNDVLFMFGETSMGMIVGWRAVFCSS